MAMDRYKDVINVRIERKKKKEKKKETAADL